MTLPNERFRSILHARNFLRDLLDPKKTPKVPKDIRQRAYWALRHFPAHYELENIRKKCPKILGEQPLDEKESENE